MVDMDAVDAFRKHALNPNHPCQRGSAQNPDIFFQAREACNPYYDALPAIVQEYMDKVNEKIGTDYKLFNYYGAADAEHVIIAMGSVCDTIEETIDYLVAAGKKVGVVKVRLYRPFSAEALINAIPETVKQISVLDRTKEPGSLGEPLYLDVVAALKGSRFESTPVFTGRYGLGSKDTTPAQIVAVYENTEKQRFTIGIVDLSLAPTPAIGDSVADILEEIGLEHAGAPGTTAALALLNDQVKKGGVMASSYVGGLSGAFIPVSEDQGMINAVQANAITLEKLEAMTCVCSVGLDMIAIPGDTKATTISGIIADEMALGMINQKTTAARLIPVIGKGVGDTVEFGGLFGYAPIMPVNQYSCDAFINRGGRIPAPIHSFKN